MRCVSYTRATSCIARQAEEGKTIETMSDEIRNYAEDLNWNISQEYSDESTDEFASAGFDRLRKDGINRQFDSVIVQSMFRFGTNAYQGVRVFQNIFYPLGIQFAVADDEFCSIGRSVEEVNEYLDSVRNRFTGEKDKEHSGDLYIWNSSNSYGFTLDLETMIISAVPEEAAVIKELFERTVAGEMPRKIAADLVKRKVPTAKSKLKKIRGWKEDEPEYNWDSDTVSSMLKNKKFKGEWERIPERCTLDEATCKIVDPALFEEAQRIIHSRLRHPPTERKLEFPFSKIITDKETGARLVQRKSYTSEEYEIRFQSPRPKGVRYPNMNMDYIGAVVEMKEILLREKKAADIADKWIRSQIGQEYKRQLIEEIRNSVPDILSQFLLSRSESVSISNAIQNYSADDNTLLESLQVEENTAASILENMVTRIREIEILFSEKNPWIKLFSDYDNDRPLTNSHLKRYVSKVEVYRFEKLEPQLKEVEWRDKFISMAGTEVDVYGTNQ